MSDNNTPQLPSAEDSMLQQIRPYLLDPREDYPEPYYMFEYRGVPLSPLGGLQAISGQKKNGKSFVLTQLMAVCLGHDTSRVLANLPGLTIPERTIEYLGHEPNVLYVDTEMEKLNSAKVLRRVHWLCNWDMKQPNDRFNVLWLREVEATDDEPAYRKRHRLIRMAIETLSPDIVFIDGVRDLIGDFNDNEASSALIQELMSLASRKHICIWTALHFNPRPGNDEESKMRGHLGTELGNKVTDTLVSVKKKDTNGVTFTVKQQDARGKDMDDWHFVVSDVAGRLGIPQITDNASTLPQTIATMESDDEMMERETVRVLKSIIMPPNSEYFTNLIKMLKKELHVGEQKAKNYFNALPASYPLLIYQRPDGRLTLSKKEVEAYDMGLPFSATPDPQP